MCYLHAPQQVIIDKAMEEMKKEEAEKAAARKRYIDDKVPPLDLQGLDLGLPHLRNHTLIQPCCCHVFMDALWCCVKMSFLYQKKKIWPVPQFKSKMQPRKHLIPAALQSMLTNTVLGRSFASSCGVLALLHAELTAHMTPALADFGGGFL